jgi:2-phospho-L-lactate guanylyltransferase (CobY/MobA/RfbA family)
MPIPQTAILLFSRTASAEAASKSFGAGEADQRITGALISRTEETIAKTGLKVYRSDEVSQRGETFGKRLANAVKEVFDQGAERLLVIGNDCPQLTASHLRSAAQKLANGENVIGPDRRGGVWLIGLQRTDFNATQFAELSWETSQLYDDLAVVLPNHTEATSLSDLNTFDDLSRQWFLLRRQISELFDLLLLSEAAFGLGPDQLEPVAVMRQMGRAPPQ